MLIWKQLFTLDINYQMIRRSKFDLTMVNASLLMVNADRKFKKMVFALFWTGISELNWICIPWNLPESWAEIWNWPMSPLTTFYNESTWQISCELYFDPLIENSSLGGLLAPLIPLKNYCCNYLPVCKCGTWTWVHRAQMILSKLCMMWSDASRLFVELW